MIPRLRSRSGTARKPPRPRGLAALVTACSLGCTLLAGPVPAFAQADTFAGKSVQMIIGFGAGGGYDLWGRTVARHIGRHLPGNPSVVPQNMPGAGSYVAASHIYNIAAKDGTVLGIIARDAALGPLSGAPGARFDPTRLSWIGTPAKETNVCIAYRGARVKSVQDLYDKQLILGDTGPGTGTRSYPRALNELLGMKFKLVGGFPSSSDVFIAMERGEVEGICESLDSIKVRRPDWIPTGKITVLLQGGAEPNPELKGVPFVRDLARNENERQSIEFLYAGQGIGRPFVAPPDLPAARLKMLRIAFDATMKDPDFAAEAKRSKLELEPEDGEHLAALIAKIYATPKAIVDRVTSLIK
jgi:tripartite-type tricarboxylate transporter receptor subunit TctC